MGLRRTLSKIEELPWPTQVVLYIAIGLVLSPIAAFLLGKADSCSQWTTEEFLRLATLEDAAPCIGAAEAVDVVDGAGATPLFLAAGKTPDPKVVGALLDAGADPTLALEGSGLTPLHHGAENPNGDVVALLIDAGADPNARTIDGFVPLHFAASNPNAEVVALLLAAGADPNAGNPDFSPLHLAVRNDNPAVTDKLLAAGADVSVLDRQGQMPLHNAESVDVVRMLLDGGAPVDARSFDAKTPLLRAAEAGNFDKARVLLEEGSNVRTKAENGVSVLHCATLLDPMPELVRLLLDHGADPTAATDFGMTALHQAAYGNGGVVEVLLNAGANANARDVDGTGPLHVAVVWNADPEVASLLIAADADVTMPDGTGASPLHLAAYWNPSPHVLDVLIEAGADPNAVDRRGDTPLHMAARRSLNARTFMDVLLAAGADPEKLNVAGERAADLMLRH